jgi:hypothetical protein
MAHTAIELEQLLQQAADASLSRPRPSRDGTFAEMAEYFVTRVLPGMREGHEVLTRRAAAGLGAGVDLPALLRGVARVDAGKSLLHLPRALLDALRPNQQRRHVLRAQLCQPVRAALSQARNHLIRRHALALGAGPRPVAFEWIGEALHLIQDSYSAAHTERALGADQRGPHPIRYIRFFGMTRRFPPQFTAAPREHAFPADPRDQITDPVGRLRPEARLAIAASRDYLQMMLRHLASPRAPRNAAELRAFMNRHLALSARPLDVCSFHSQCCPVSPSARSREAEAMLSPYRDCQRPDLGQALRNYARAQRALRRALRSGRGLAEAELASWTAWRQLQKARGEISCTDR